MATVCNTENPSLWIGFCFCSVCLPSVLVASLLNSMRHGNSSFRCVTKCFFFSSLKSLKNGAKMLDHMESGSPRNTGTRLDADCGHRFGPKCGHRFGPKCGHSFFKMVARISLKSGPEIASKWMPKIGATFCPKSVPPNLDNM